MAHPTKSVESEELGKSRQFLAAFMGSLIALSCGSMIAWSSPALPMLAEFGSRPEVNPEQGSWVGSLLTLGAFIGALPGGMLADRLGRKRLLLYMSLPLYASWSILMWTVSVHGLYIGRFLGGLVIGVVSVTIPMYINEISDSSIRGTLGTFFQLQIVIGILLQYLFGLFGDVFRMTLTSSFIPILFFIIFYFFPESPVWLSERGQREEAKKSLQWLQLPSQTIQTTQREETQTLSVMQVLKDVPARRGLIISLGLMLFQQICGVNAVVFYTNEVYKKTGTSIEPFTASLITAVVQVCSTFVSTILIDRAGRRLLLLVSYAVMTTCLGALGFFIYLTQDRGHDLPGLSLLPVIAICTYCFVFNFGAGPVAWIMMAELVRPAARGVISAATAAVSWGLAFVVTKTFEDLTIWIGAGQTFGLFGVGAFLGGIFVMAFVPETKGKDVEYVVKKLSKRTSKNNVLI